MISTKRHAKLALAYFLVAAILGLVLRTSYTTEIPITYRYVVHSHSHIALLGWVYMALTTLLYKLFLEGQGLEKKYRNLFLFTQFALVGMLFTFPFTGYALFSIIFSTLFLFASYWFSWLFIKYTPLALKQTNSFSCIKAALIYLVISSIGPWALGGIMTTLGPTSNWYRIAIYFYLHFQYNGWMIMALLGILFFVLERNNIALPKSTFKSVYWSINLGIILTFFLSVLFTEPSSSLYLISGLGGLLQLWALAVLFKINKELKRPWGTIFSGFEIGLLKWAAFLIAVKMILQLLTALPYFANLATTVLDFTIGYLHWTFLGVVSISLFLFLHYYKLIRIPKNFIRLYLVGFVTTEGIIFYKGIASWLRFSLFDGYFLALVMASATIPIALIYLLVFPPKN
ncbi:hypothetical protein K8352_18395 [Flavobacteriaceae bacterium F89]|uniref:Uncharacterized protein n=1 Tax=Cerina litoralis TaxID=2874477 RepID=A0AAE3EYK8_9FLAO|nr:hypothetical protein [Cerina litoralis]MCG2462739.1 hypothetical protein [Cerina litoralis]